VDALNDFVVSLATSWWVLPVVLMLVVVDGFFPPVPSESVIVGLSALGIASGFPSPWLLLLTAFVGSFLGDNIAFLIGRRLGVGKFRLMRGKRLAKIMHDAAANLERAPAAVIVTARFVPVGRVVVNVLAGSTGFSRRRFLGLSAIAGLAWASYSVVVGIVAGAWIHDNPVLGAGIAILAAMSIGIVVDRLITRRANNRRSHTSASIVVPRSGAALRGGMTP
jgi:membrane-associated protein